MTDLRQGSDTVNLFGHRDTPRAGNVRLKYRGLKFDWSALTVTDRRFVQPPFLSDLYQARDKSEEVGKRSIRLAGTYAKLWTQRVYKDVKKKKKK